MIRFSFNIGCSESKVIFKSRNRENVRTKCISFSLSQNSLRTTQTVNTQKIPPWAWDKGCAEACTERFSVLKEHSTLKSWQIFRYKPSSLAYRWVDAKVCPLIDDIWLCFYIPVSGWRGNLVVSIADIKSATEQRGCRLTLHTQKSILIWRVLGKVNRPHQDNSEEGPWTIIFNFYYPADHCCWNWSYPEWQTSDTCFIQHTR